MAEGRLILGGEGCADSKLTLEYNGHWVSFESIVEWRNLYQPYDEGLEVTLFLIVLLALTLLYRDDKMKKPRHSPA